MESDSALKQITKHELNFPRFVEYKHICDFRQGIVSDHLLVVTQPIMIGKQFRLEKLQTFKPGRVKCGETEHWRAVVGRRKNCQRWLYFATVLQLGIAS